MINDLIRELDSKGADFLNYFRDQLAGIRSGRPTVKLVENILAEYLGQKLAVKRLGSINIKPPREIDIMVWDIAAAPAVSSAIENQLNLKPLVEKNIIRLNLPPLSEERRLELVKLVRRESEDTRIKIRNFRDELLRKIKKLESESKINEDDKFQLKEKIDKEVQRLNAEIEKMAENKIKEINA